MPRLITVDIGTGEPYQLNITNTLNGLKIRVSQCEAYAEQEITFEELSRFRNNDFCEEIIRFLMFQVDDFREIIKAERYNYPCNPEGYGRHFK